MNAAFQRIARSNKKAFLSDQCKEMGENNRMGKTRDLLKKIRDSFSTERLKQLEFLAKITDSKWEIKLENLFW